MSAALSAALSSRWAQVVEGFSNEHHAQTQYLYSQDPSTLSHFVTVVLWPPECIFPFGLKTVTRAVFRLNWWHHTFRQLLFSGRSDLKPRIQSLFYWGNKTHLKAGLAGPDRFCPRPGLSVLAGSWGISGAKHTCAPVTVMF